MLALLVTLALAAPDGGTSLKELAAQVGKQVDGKVVSVMKTGAFVNVGGIEGLVHVSDIDWSGATDARTLLKVGQRVKVTILSVNLERNEMSLSMRRAEDEPWKKAPKKYAVGSVTQAKVLASAPGVKGVFFELEPTVEAFVHVSELPAGKRPPDYTPGQLVDLKILEVDSVRHRVSGSLKLP